MKQLIAFVAILASFSASDATPLRKQQVAEHPFRNAEIGDWAEYAVVDSFGPKWTQREAVTNKDEKTITISSRQLVGPKSAEIDSKVVTLDKTFVFNWGLVPAPPLTANVEERITGTGSEVIDILGKKYDSKWQTMRLKSRGAEYQQKIWSSELAPMSGVLQQEFTVGGKTVRWELIRSGKRGQE